MRSLRVLRERDEIVRSRVRREIADLLDGGADPPRLVAAALRAHAAIDDEGSRAIARAPSLAPACAEGCSSCCHVHVDATIPEILAIADHLARTWSVAEVIALRDRLADQVRRTGRLTDEDRWAAKIPCALLGEGGRCAIYAVRPLRCRAFHSLDVEPCREAFAGRDGADPVRARGLERAHDAVEEGFDQALTEAGLTADGHRLEAGLLVALEDPEAGDRWRAGEPVFARAERR